MLQGMEEVRKETLDEKRKNKMECEEREESKHKTTRKGKET